MTSIPSLTDRPFAPPSPVASVVIEMPGEPKGKGRPRFSRKSGTAYTPDTTRVYEGNLAYAAAQAMAGKKLFEGALRVDVIATFGIRTSWSRRKQADALNGLIRPTKRPDLDNIVKMLDALNHVVWRDDCQIVSAKVTKNYGDCPRLVIMVEAL